MAKVYSSNKLTSQQKETIRQFIQKVKTKLENSERKKMIKKMTKKR